jgi:hypothetical protein
VGDVVSGLRYDYSPVRLLGTVEEVIELLDWSNAMRETGETGRYCMPISGDDIARGKRS